MCRNCGAIVGAGETQCAVCGANTTNASRPEKIRYADGEAVRFAKGILSRPYKFTIVLLIVNLFIFFLMWQASGVTGTSLWKFPNQVLWAFGAKLNSSINEQHQWWRLVTPIFVHVNLLHMFVNMYSLWMIGPFVEKLYGPAKFVFFYVVTGIAGVVASYLSVKPNLAVGPARFLFKNQDVLSAGASGALFGLVGVLFIFGLKFRHELPEGFKRAFGTGMLPTILINLFIGYVARGILDNAAHLGGLLSGAVLALAVDYRRLHEPTRLSRIWQILQWSMLGLAVFGFIKVAQHYRDPLPANFPRQEVVSPEDVPPEKFVVYAQAMNDGQDAFFQLVIRKDATLADNAIKQLEAAPALDPAADDLKNRLKNMVVRANEFHAAGGSADNSPDSARATRALVSDFENWSRDYQRWLKTSGKDYGLVEETKPAQSPQ